MRITDALRGEHGAINRMLDYCATNASTWEIDAAKVAGGTLESALRSHAKIENELLLDSMELHLPERKGLLVVMRGEHDEIEGNLELLDRAQDVKEARRILVRLAAAARGHFSKEEEILFPLAEQHLGQEKLVELGRRWSEERKVELG
jgi:hemerythrin-like domain-containing protein